MSELRRQLDQLSRQVSVPPPDLLRKRGDRRGHRQAGIAVVACLTVVVGGIGLHDVPGRLLSGMHGDAGGQCSSVPYSSYSPSGPGISAGALLTAAVAGPHWYPGTQVGRGQMLPQLVAGTDGHPLPSSERQERFRIGEILRGGTATDWQLRETVIRYRAGAATTAMAELRTAPGCSNHNWRNISVSDVRRQPGYESLVVRTSAKTDLPGFTIVGRVGDYQVLLDINQYGDVPSTDRIGSSAWIAWLTDTALARVAAAEGLADGPTPGARPADPIRSTRAPSGMLSAAVIGPGWYVGNSTTDAESSPETFLGGDCSSLPQRSREQLYRRDDPRDLRIVIESVSSFPAGLAPAVMAQLTAHPCPGYSFLTGTVNAGDDSVVLSLGAMVLVLIRVKDQIVGLENNDSTAALSATYATLQRLAIAAVSALHE